MIGGQSRTGFVILFFGLIIFAALNNKKMRSDYKKLLQVTVMIGISFVVVAFFLGEIDFGNSGEMLSSRISMWLMGLKVFAEHPIFGIGNNAYTAFNSDFSLSYLRWEATNPVHSIYIMELAETGIVGTCLIFGIFYFSLIKFAFKRALDSVYYEALFVIFFTQLLYGFTGWVFYSPSLRFLNMLILVVLLRMGDFELASTKCDRG
jgi:O-antigen ligase